MRSIITVFFFSILANFANAQISDFIQVDQFGYLPNSTKVAVLSNPQVGYNSNQSYNPSSTIELRNASNDQVIYSASPTLWNNGSTHVQSGDQGWWFDFSSITAPGNYYVIDVINNERSANFEIGSDVYGPVIKAAGRMFFYNRCNFPKNAPYAIGGWTDGQNFMNPLQDANCRYVLDSNNASLEKDLSGGWFDAGDYNKYVTFAHETIHSLLWAYQENPLAFGDDWNIPESGNGIPDILDEVKWELDWLMKMANNDGAVHIKMGSISFNDNSAAPPSANSDQRYYGPTCTSASIACASIFAFAAKVYPSFDPIYATTLQNEAVSAWNYVLPFINNNTLETDCDDGTIKAGDADWDVPTQLENALTAAVHLYDLTGSSSYNSYIGNHINDAESISIGSWSPYRMPNNDALLLYTTLSGANTSVVNTIMNAVNLDVTNNFQGYFGFNSADLYRAFMPDWSYHWGSNQPKANYANLNNLILKYNINSNSAASYSQYIDETIHYFNGVNPMGLVQLSNMYNLGGDRCVNEVYHTWFNDGSVWDNALTSQFGPPPGFLTGGANVGFSVTTLSPPSGQPRQKSYLDFNQGFPNNAWEISEPAIYYQAAFVRMLANRVDYTLTSIPNVNLTSDGIELYNLCPNPANNQITVQGTLSNYIIDIVDFSGTVVNTVSSGGTEVSIDISNFNAGVYFISIKHPTNGNVFLETIVKE